MGHVVPGLFHGLGESLCSIGKEFIHIKPLMRLTGMLSVEDQADTLIVAMMAIGIGVDDTLHFVMRYQIEARKPEETISQARWIDVPLSTVNPEKDTPPVPAT